MRSAINTRKRTPKQIPFADAVLSLLGRRRAALDLIEGIESIGDGIIDTLDAAELPLAEPTLLLQKMENRLVRHHLETPDVLSSEELRKLRYILSFARLAGGHQVLDVQCPDAAPAQAGQQARHDQRAELERVVRNRHDPIRSVRHG
jgi:hypothetical protein